MKKFTTLLLLYSIFMASKTNAQFTYPNETCDGAMLLNVSSNTTLTNSVYLSNDFADEAFSPIPNCAGANIRRDYWYKFTAPDTAVSIVSKVITTDVASLSCQLFTGTCNGLVSIACYSGALTYTLSGLTTGQEYYIRSIGALSTLAADTKIINLNLLAKPQNDDCTGAIQLPVWDSDTEGTLAIKRNNALATLSTGCTATVPSGWTNMKDVWYKFTATATAHTVKIEAATGCKGIVYCGQPGAFTAIESFQFTGATEIANLTGLVSGQTYYIRFASGAPVSFSIGVYTNAPANDNCSTADTIYMSSSFNCDKSFFVNNRLTATTSSGGCNSMPEDVWFVFQAASTGATIRVTEGGSIRLGLLQGNCGALTCLANNTTGEFTYNGLTVGNYYYLQVGSTGSSRILPLSICISPAITNDDCSGAIALPVKPYGQWRNTIAYTGNATQSMGHCALSGTNNDLWYSFVAIDTACVVTIDGGATFEVFTGSCGTLTSIYCSGSADLPVNAEERRGKVTGLVPGNVYYLSLIALSTQRIYSVDVNSLPPNDECSGAKQLTPQQNMDFDFMDDNGILFSSE